MDNVAEGQPYNSHQSAVSIELLTLALNRVGEAAYLFDEQARLHFVNDESCRALAYSRDELLSLNAAEIDPDCTATRWDQHWDELRSRGALNFEARHRTKAGHIFPVEIRASYFEHEGRAYDLALVRDISRQKRAEQDHHVHLRFLESMDKVNRIIQATDDIARLLPDILDAMLEIFGCDRAWLSYPCDPTAKFWRVPMERTHPDHPGGLALGVDLPMTPEVAGMHRQMLAAQSPLHYTVGTADKPTAGPINERFNIRAFIGTCLRPKIGKPWVFGMHQCSHARIWSDEDIRLFQEIGRRFEDALTSLLAYRDLRESELRYREVFEHSSDHIVVLDVVESIGAMPRFRFAAINPALERLLGQSNHGVEGQWVEDVAADHVATEVLPKFRRCVELGAMLHYEESLRLAGSPRELETTLVPVHNEAGQIYRLIGISRDITERKAAESALQLANQDLERRVEERTAALAAVNEELETFAYSVSHDLKAPLRWIDGYSQLLEQGYSQALDPDAQILVGNVRRAARHMTTLIDDLLAYSRIERQQFNTGHIALDGLARQVVNEYAEELRTHEAVLRFTVPALASRADREGLTVVIRNLLGNALKFSKQAQPPIIEIGGAEQDDRVLLWIRDNGIGFDMRFHDRIFEIFQRLQRIEDYPGTGIGLALVRKAITRMGGRVWAQSALGAGATFFIELPKDLAYTDSASVSKADDDPGADDESATA